MNKLIAFVLALALALTLVGCNKEKSNENNETHIFQGEIIEFDNGAMLENLWKAIQKRNMHSAFAW